MLGLPEIVMLAVAKITAKGQTTLPQSVRTALHITLGDFIAIVEGIVAMGDLIFLDILQGIRDDREYQRMRTVLQPIN